MQKLTRYLRHPIVPPTAEKLSFGREIGRFIKGAIENVNEIAGIGLITSITDTVSASQSLYVGQTYRHLRPLPGKSTYPVLQQAASAFRTEFAVQDGAGPVICFVHLDEVVALRHFPR